MKSFATNICNERPASCQQQHVNTIIFIRDAVRDREAVAESAIQSVLSKASPSLHGFSIKCTCKSGHVCFQTTLGRAQIHILGF